MVIKTIWKNIKKNSITCYTRQREDKTVIQEHPTTLFSSLLILFFHFLQNSGRETCPFSRPSSINLSSFIFIASLILTPPPPLSLSFSLNLSFILSLIWGEVRMQRQQHHISPSSTDYAAFDFNVRPSKRRGSYNCGRCGQPKKGHNCHLTTPTASSSPSAATPTPSDSSAGVSASASLSANRPPHYSHLRRALSFDNIDLSCDSPEPDVMIDEQADPDSITSGGLPAVCLWEVLRRLPPPGLLAAAKVCKGWRDTSRRLWRAAEELRLRVPLRAQVGFVGSVLKKCPGLVRLSLRMERLGFLVRLTLCLLDLCF